MIYRHIITAFFIFLFMSTGINIYAQEIYYAEEDPTVNLEVISRLLVYPESARQARIEGTVMLYVLVTKDGRADSIKIYRSADTILSLAAIDAVRKAEQFTPGRTKGQPVTAWMFLPIKFALREKVVPFVNPTEALIAILTDVVDDTDDEEQAKALYNRGLVYYSYNDTNKAQDDYRRSIALDPTTNRPFYNKAGLPEVLTIEDILEEDAPDLTGYGLVLLEHSAEKALEYADKALDEDKDYAPAWFLRSLAHRKLGNIDKATSSCNRALTLDTKNAEYMSLLGRLFYETGEDTAALKCLNEALSINPTMAEAAYTAAVVALRSGTGSNDIMKKFQTVDDKFSSNSRLRQQAIADLKVLVQKGISTQEAQQILKEVFHVE